MEKIFSKYTSEKGLTSKHIRIISSSAERKQVTTKKLANNLDRHFSKL